MQSDSSRCHPLFITKCESRTGLFISIYSIFFGNSLKSLLYYKNLVCISLLPDVRVTSVCMRGWHMMEGFCNIQSNTCTALAVSYAHTATALVHSMCSMVYLEATEGGGSIHMMCSCMAAALASCGDAGACTALAGFYACCP